MAMEPPQQRYHTLEDPGFPRSAREAREQARASVRNGNPNGNGSSPRYRRPQSPDAGEDYRFADEDARSPTSDVALQDAMLAQAQQQQRVVPVNQQLSRGAGGPRRQPPNGMPNKNGGSSMPPGYPGPPMEDGPQPQPQTQPREGGRYRRHTRRPSDAERPSERPNPGSSSSLPRNAGPPGSPQGPPNPQQNRMSQPLNDSPQHQQRHPHSPQGLTVPGADISRINSPSIATSVLLPLEQKIHEYEHLMDEANTQMNQLDNEIRALQERRLAAEERFIEAKSKHDEYERQHMDVGRALRGDIERERAAPPPPRPMPRMDSMDSFDRPASVQSSIQKPKGRGMLRMSLFNKSS